MERISAASIEPKMNSTKVAVAGWVHAIRDIGNLKFVVLRDRTGLVQLTAHRKNAAPELFSLLEALHQEDVIWVHGWVRANPQAPNGVEIAPLEVRLLSKSGQPLPLDPAEKTEALFDTRLDNRSMDVRKQKISAIFTLKSELLHAARDFFISNGFVEIHTPKIVAAGAEGGATLFTIKYYDKDAYLSQSPQLYKQMMMASGLDRVFEIAPAYRAEKSDTNKHLSEFISVDAEIAFIESEDDVMDLIEALVKDLLAKAGESAAAKKLNIKIPSANYAFPRMTVKEACDLLGRDWGDLTTDEEKRFGEIMREKGFEFYFLTKYPSSTKPFYIMVDETNPEISRGMDLDFRGLEVTSGGQREHRIEKLEERMKALGLNPADFEFYLKSFRYGMPPHGGFGFGIERFVQNLAGLGNVRETVLFPRDRNRLVP